VGLIANRLKEATFVDSILTLEHIIGHRGGLLAELHRRQAIVRDYVRGVGRQYATGAYLFGRPGTAKTHTVRAVLEQEIREIFTYQRGHITPMGLFELIASHSDEVIVLDDLGAVLKSDVALQILLSALEHPTSRDRSRVVKYRRQGREERAVFRGGIICISNRELHDDELLGAFKSRVIDQVKDMLDYVSALEAQEKGRGLSTEPKDHGKSENLASLAAEATRDSERKLVWMETIRRLDAAYTAAGTDALAKMNGIEIHVLYSEKTAELEGVRKSLAEHGPDDIGQMHAQKLERQTTDMAAWMRVHCPDFREMEQRASKTSLAELKAERARENNGRRQNPGTGTWRGEGNRRRSPGSQGIGLEGRQRNAYGETSCTKAADFG
jgi:hypothetical protein